MKRELQWRDQPRTQRGKHWQFETRVKGKLFSRSIGEWPSVSIETAKAEAPRLRGLTEQGIDPREGERQQQEAKTAAMDHLTIHGLRRSFSPLGEAAGCTLTTVQSSVCCVLWEHNL